MKTAGRVLAAALILGTCGHTASRAPVARRCAQIDRDNQQALAAFAQTGGKAVPEEFKRALHDAARCVETPHGAWGLAIGSLTVDDYEGRLQPIIHNDEGISPNDFASTVHPVSDISLIGCVSRDFLLALIPLMIAYGKGQYEGHKTTYWGTDTLVYQQIVGDLATGVKTNGLYQDVKGTEDIQKVLTGPLINVMGPKIK